MKIRLLKLPPLLFILLSVCSACTAQGYKVRFTVDAGSLPSVQKIGLRGNLKPLSWEKDYPLTDSDNDGVYEATISFVTSKKNVRFKYSSDGRQELEGSNTRIIWFKADEIPTAKNVFDEFDYYPSTTIEKLVYTPAQINEDLAVLRKTLNHIHPNLYKYRDSMALERDYAELKSNLLANPGLINMYGEISKFAAKIKCSHTFTNPWNQGPDIAKSLFFQSDKLPLTFKRIGKRIFLDRNASNDPNLKKGMEIVAINDVPAPEIMERLANYSTSDGNNHEKKLQRLTLDGISKYDLFDIFYPIEFGSSSAFRLVLKDQKTGGLVNTRVKALSKTGRNTILRKRYADFKNTFEDGWQFHIKNKTTAVLRIDAFTVFNTDFDWKDFLEDVFKKLKKQGIENLIIDIRANEGGDTIVAEFLLEYLIEEPITIALPAQTTRYRKIPDDLKKYVGTWDKRPYDWGNKLKYLGNGNFELQSMFVPTTKTFRPKKNNFKGEVYLLTSAVNSSATHIMATYAKKYALATLVGQETGGNQKGLNGGYIFFMKLPNSRIELDIPVFGINILENGPEIYDGGIVPDIPVVKNVPDLLNGIDSEIEAVLGLIAKNQTNK